MSSEPQEQDLFLKCLLEANVDLMLMSIGALADPVLLQQRIDCQDPRPMCCANLAPSLSATGVHL